MNPQLAQAVRLATEGRDEEAVKIVARLAHSGDREALFILADMHWRGGPVEQDLPRGRRLFEAAAKAGHPRAVPIATNLLASGIAGPRDWPQALEMLKREGKTDPARAELLALLARMDLTVDGEPRALPKFERLSTSPWVIRFPRVFSEVECDYLVRAAEPHLAPSRVPVRTAESMRVQWLAEDPVIHALNRRVAAMSASKPEQGEPLMILRYRPGQEFRPHHDWTSDGNPRFQTVLVYLNQGYGGGETEFPQIGLKIQGRQGDAIAFRNARADGDLDRQSEHAGRPVLGGVKYLASRWIRAGRYSP